MSETTGSATDFEDLMSKFLTWAAASAGWTVDETIGTVDSGRQCALHKGNNFIQFRWGTTMGSHASMHQSTAYSAATRAGAHTGDSGNGYNSNNSTVDTNLDNERCLHEVGDGPFPSYYFYTDGDDIRVVVETATDTFLHFGAGTIDKFGDWDTGTGGEFAYGQSYSEANSANSTISGWLLDGGASAVSGNDTRLKWPTMLLSGLPNQGGSEVWATVGGARTHTQFDDTAGNDRAVCMGGFRGGPIPRGLGNFPAGNTSGLAPLVPVAVFYLDRSVSPVRAYLLGWQPGVRMVDLTYLAPKDTFTLGADTWRVFPVVRRVEGGAQGDTDFLGIAYKV